jgi:hypothetical protein
MKRKRRRKKKKENKRKRVYFRWGEKKRLLNFPYPSLHDPLIRWEE